MSIKELLLVKVYHGGQFLGKDYVGGECLLLRGWDLELYGDSYVTEVISLVDHYSTLVKYAFKKPNRKDFVFVIRDFKQSISQCINKKRKVLEVFLEFDVDIEGKKIISEEGNRFEEANDEGKEAGVKGYEGDGSDEDEGEGEDGSDGDEGEVKGDGDNGEGQGNGWGDYEFDGFVLSEDEQLDDGMSTEDFSEDDLEFLEARTKLMEDKLRVEERETAAASLANMRSEKVSVEKEGTKEDVAAHEREEATHEERVEATHEEREEDIGVNLHLFEKLPNDQLDSDVENESMEDEGYSSLLKNFVRPRNIKDIELELGLTFGDTDECKKAVRDWAIANGYDIKWDKSSGGKLQAICRSDGCKWRLYASRIRGEPTCVIRTLSDPHECPFARNNRSANAEWIAEYFLPKLKVNPHLSAKDMKEELYMNFELKRNFPIIYRARALAMLQISGTLFEHYAKLGSYLTELKRNDKEGRFELRTHLNAEGNRIFDRMYIGFSALRKGFLVGCRRFIGFDACFLKTLVGGVLLAAVSKDGDNRMYPIAWAVVEKENEATWTWFFELLFEDLDITDGLGWTFMSDKQKGLINGIAALAPHAEHRNCARHIYANWRKKFTGKKFKKLFWNCVKATTPSEYNLCLGTLRRESSNAADDFLDKNPQSFCKSLINPLTKSDLIVNNICECFNSFIMEGRDKPVIDLLQHIRASLMTRIYNHAKSMESHDDYLSPYVRNKLGRLREIVRMCVVKPAIGDKYEVHIHDDAFVVDLLMKECSCRSWELTGIPCSHAMSCILHRREDLDSYVDTFYCKSTLTECYKFGIQPLPGDKHWPVVDGAPILPPHFTRLPGRPKKCRKRSVDEVADKNTNKLSARGMKMSCRRCGAFGHNVRTCKEAQVEPTSSSTRQPRVSKRARAAGSREGIPTARQPRAPNAKAKEQRVARKGIGAYTSPGSGNIYFKPSTTQRTSSIVTTRAAAASRTTSNVDIPTQGSQVVDKSTPSQPH